MKRSKIFMAAGAFVLAIAAVFATKANKKFASLSTVYAATLGNLKIAVPANEFYTAASKPTGSYRVYANFFTASGTSIAPDIYLTTTASGADAYYK